MENFAPITQQTSGVALAGGPLIAPWSPWSSHQLSLPHRELSASRTCADVLGPTDSGPTSGAQGPLLGKMVWRWPSRKRTVTDY